MNISSQIAAVVCEVENSQLGPQKVKSIGKHVFYKCSKNSNKGNTKRKKEFTWDGKGFLDITLWENGLGGLSTLSEDPTTSARNWGLSEIPGKEHNTFIS